MSQKIGWVLCMLSIVLVVGCNISGTITDKDGNPVADVSVTLSNGAQDVMIHYTDDQGQYLFENNRPGTYRVTPSKDGYVFTPGSRTVTIVSESVTGVDFSASVVTNNCFGNDMCADNEYCYFRACAAETGQCRQRPEACMDVVDPVCGCDGKTYSNACYAAMAGVSVDHVGDCNDACLPVMCDLYCEYGFKTDKNGCEICECRCSPVMCTLYCEYGFKKDGNGCDICECECPPVTCGLDCKYGVKKDPYGCDTCECLDINFCSSDMECACGVDTIVGDCAMGNRMYIDTSKQCPDFCTGIAGNLRTVCRNGKCVSEMIP